MTLKRDKETQSREDAIASTFLTGQSLQLSADAKVAWPPMMMCTVRQMTLGWKVIK